MITSDLNQVKSALINGDIIALPTETVYGLAANIYLDSALEKVFKLKKRPSYNPLIVHISNASILEQIAKNIPAKALHCLCCFVVSLENKKFSESTS